MTGRRAFFITIASGLLFFAGCYAPLHSPGVRASSLPEVFRIPMKTHSVELNYAMLKQRVPPAYVLGPGDLIRVEISDLIPRVRRQPAGNEPERAVQGPFSYVTEALVTERGEVLLPLVGHVHVAGSTLEQAHQQIVNAYTKGFLDNPRVAVVLLRPSTTRVMVIGHVARPDVYELPKYENDIAHAITRAGGLLEEGADEIQVHRRTGPELIRRLPPMIPAPATQPVPDLGCDLHVLRIPLRSNPPVLINSEQAVLQDGDVVVVRSRPDEVFFVVGELNPNTMVRFSLGRENRDLGNGFVLPEDRDVDVVTAVAMAGYIHPINSPTTVTVHRTLPGGKPMLIHVDLIAARFDQQENIMVQAGDIIYLNPDAPWWFRRTFDRMIPEVFTFPYERAILKAFGQDRR